MRSENIFTASIIERIITICNLHSSPLLSFSTCSLTVTAQQHESLHEIQEQISLLQSHAMVEWAPSPPSMQTVHRREGRAFRDRYAENSRLLKSLLTEYSVAKYEQQSQSTVSVL